MNRAFQCTPFAVSVIASLLVASNATGQHNDISGAPGQPPLDWHSLEAPLLTNHTQLTSAAQFMKAGEAYFSPNMAIAPSATARLWVVQRVFTG